MPVSAATISADTMVRKLLPMASRAPVGIAARRTEARALTSGVTALEATSLIELARRNPEQTAHVIRQWVAGAE